MSVLFIYKLYTVFVNFPTTPLGNVIYIHIRYDFRIFISKHFN